MYRDRRGARLSKDVFRRELSAGALEHSRADGFVILVAHLVHFFFFFFAKWTLSIYFNIALIPGVVIPV